MEGPPDLVVEIVSPSTAGPDGGIKLDRLCLYGVGVYWIVDPEERTVEIWRLANGVDEPPVLTEADTLHWQPDPSGPALSIELEGLFEG